MQTDVKTSIGCFTDKLWGNPTGKPLNALEIKFFWVKLAVTVICWKVNIYCSLHDTLMDTSGKRTVLCCWNTTLLKPMYCS